MEFFSTKSRSNFDLANTNTKSINYTVNIKSRGLKNTDQKTQKKFY